MLPREALFLSLMVPNCSGQTSFSRFKRIKNKLKGVIFRKGLSADFYSRCGKRVAAWSSHCAL